MENLLTEFKESLNKLGITKKDRLLLAVSGGMDSIVLTSCCSMAELDFGIAHVNFQLRGPESQRDEDFVCRLADKYGKPFLSKKFDTQKYAEYSKISIQEAARELRYAWFKTLIGKEPDHFQFLLTAHHLDDNLETLVMHFFRGTGIKGLLGIPKKNEYILRPLLSFPRNHLKAFADDHKLDWVEDSSNALDDYTRNYFRNQLFPSLTNIYPSLHKNLENNLERLSEAAILYEQAIGFHKKKLVKPNGSELQIPILLLKKSVPLRTILYEILRVYQFTPAQTDEVIRLMDSSNGKFVSSYSHRIIKNRRWLIIAPLETTGISHMIIQETDQEINYPEGKLRIKHIVVKDLEPISKDPGIAMLDADKIQYPLILRKWKAGDYFYPLGMKKKKKLSRFFIDQKISKPAKEKVWVIQMDSQLIWVIGQRIDNRFCISPFTKRILQIRLSDGGIA